jgi:hypothetical protein
MGRGVPAQGQAGARAGAGPEEGVQERRISG